MMISGSKVYETFRTHLNIGDDLNTMDIYAAWAVWKAAYASGQRGAEQAGAIDMLRRIERWLGGNETQSPDSMREEVRNLLRDFDAITDPPPL